MRWGKKTGSKGVRWGVGGGGGRGTDGRIAVGMDEGEIVRGMMVEEKKQLRREDEEVEGGHLGGS